MFLKSKKSSLKKQRVNQHFIFIEASRDLIAPEVILWGEAVWWPKNSSMKFTCLTRGDIQAGTKYRQEVLLPFAPKWEVEVTRLVSEKEIERTFLNGMFKGKETVTLEERYNGTKVEYVMHYEVVGIVNQILWKLFFQRLHDQNIEMILKALQGYVMNKQKTEAS